MKKNVQFVVRAGNYEVRAQQPDVNRVILVEHCDEYLQKHPLPPIQAYVDKECLYVIAGQQGRPTNVMCRHNALGEAVDTSLPRRQQQKDLSDSKREDHANNSTNRQLT